MVWEWIGVIVGFVVVVPLLLFFLQRLLRPALAIKAVTDDILEHGVGLASTLDSVDALVTTEYLTAAAKVTAPRYVNAVGKVLAL